MNTNLAREEIVENIVTNMYGLPTVTKEMLKFKQSEGIVNKTLKRIIDIIGALVGIIILIPMTVVLYIVKRRN